MESSFYQFAIGDQDLAYIQILIYLLQRAALVQSVVTENLNEWKFFNKLTPSRKHRMIFNIKGNINYVDECKAGSRLVQ